MSDFGGNVADRHACRFHIITVEGDRMGWSYGIITGWSFVTCSRQVGP